MGEEDCMTSPKSICVGGYSIVGNRGFRTVELIDIIVLHPLFIRMTSLKEVRNQLLINHNEGV